jgi:hypothetical protein
MSDCCSVVAVQSCSHAGPFFRLYVYGMPLHFQRLIGRCASENDDFLRSRIASNVVQVLLTVLSGSR